MKFTEQDRQAMDNSVTDAENDLTNVDEDSLIMVANWWSKWYMYAGHKRLARILLQYARKELSGEV